MITYPGEKWPQRSPMEITSIWHLLFHRQWTQLVAPIYSEMDVDSLHQPLPGDVSVSWTSGWVSRYFRRHHTKPSLQAAASKATLLLPQQHLCWDQITPLLWWGNGDEERSWEQTAAPQCDPCDAATTTSAQFQSIKLDFFLTAL